MTAEERKARAKAAAKMGLVKDPGGENLPDELWMQSLPPDTLVGMILRLRARAHYLENQLSAYGHTFDTGEG